MRVVWAINNHPSTREQSIHQASIPWETHEAWFEARLAEAPCLMWIAEREREVVGLVRFAVDDPPSQADISVAVHPDRRGRGVGSWLIAVGTTRAFDAHPALARIVAVVRPDNEPSLRAFAKAGYTPDASVTIEGHAYRTLVCRREGAAEGAP